MEWDNKVKMIQLGNKRHNSEEDIKSISQTLVIFKNKNLLKLI